MRSNLKKILLFFLVPIVCFGQGNYNFAKIDSIGTAIEETIAAQDKSYINELFDVQEFAKKFLMGTDNAMVLDYNTAFLEALKETFDIGTILVDNGEYNLLRMYIDADNQFHLLFRLYSAAGINYHDYLVKQLNGSFKLVDIYVFYTGRNLSDTYRDRYMETLTRQDFFVVTRDFKKENKAYEKYLTYIEKGHYEKAYSASFSVSEERQQSKPFKLLQLKIAQNLSSTILDEVMTDFQQTYPDDPSLWIRMIDFYAENKQYDKSLACIERIDKAVEGDSFLDIYRGNIYFEQGDLAMAKSYFMAVIENYPYFIEAYDFLFAVYLKLEDFQKAIKTLDIMVAKLGYTKSELRDYILDQHPAFARTAAYQTWN